MVTLIFFSDFDSETKFFRILFVRTGLRVFTQIFPGVLSMKKGRDQRKSKLMISQILAYFWLSSITVSITSKFVYHFILRARLIKLRIFVIYRCSTRITDLNTMSFADKISTQMTARTAPNSSFFELRTLVTLMTPTLCGRCLKHFFLLI